MRGCPFRLLLAMACLLAGTGPLRAFEATQPLAAGDQVLNGGFGRLSLPIQVPEAAPLTGATLLLTYENALAALPAESRLRVAIDGRPIARLPMVGAQRPVGAEIDVPGNLLPPGRHELTLTSDLRHRRACDAAALTELWTKIQGARSSLTLRGDTATGSPPELDQLDSLLAASQYDGEPFVIATAEPAPAATVGWGGDIAQGIALRRGLRPVVFAPQQLGENAFSTRKGANVAIVGTVDEVTPITGELGPIYDGTVILRRLPADPDHLALIFTGPDDDAVTRATAAFSQPRIDWPKSERAVVSQMVALAPRPRPAVIPSQGGTRHFSELGYRTVDDPLSFRGGHDIEFVMPPTRYTGDGQRLTLHLNYAYAPGLATTSAIIVMVNGHQEGLARLDRIGGDVVDRRRLELPMGLFRPGRNWISLVPVLQPTDDMGCPSNERPVFTLFDDSTLTMPHVATLDLQASLSRFTDWGYPIADGPDPGAAIIAMDASADTLGATYALMGKLAQMRGRNLAGVRARLGPLEPEHNALLIGPESALTGPARQAFNVAWGLTLEDQGTFVGVASSDDGADGSARERWRQEVQGGGGLQAVHDALNRLLGFFTSQVAARPIQPAGEVSLDLPYTSFDASLTAMRSPFREDRALFVLAVRNGQSLAVATNHLVRPATWDRLTSRGVRWNIANSRITLAPPQPEFLLATPRPGPRDAMLLLRAYLSRNRFVWLVLAGIVILLAAVMTASAVRLRTRGR